MNYTHNVRDYISDVPLEIGRRFLPPPMIRLPVIPLPKFNEIELNYDFEAELRARKAYEEKDKRPDIHATTVTSQGSTTESDSSISTTSSTLTPVMNFTTEVLQPSRSTVLPVQSANNVQKTLSQNNHFADFELAGANVFDELELKTIDDKAALSQVLGSLSLANSRKTPPNGPPIPPLVKSQEVQLNVTNGYTSASFTSNIPPSVGPQTPLTPAPAYEMPGSGWSTPTSTNFTVQSQNAQVRSRLLTKGYRENIVDVAFQRLPKEKMTLIEYYMKGMRTLEKVNVNPAETILFLMECDLKEKQLIVDYATVAAQLVTMGFPAKNSFNATRNSNGDRVKALETLLSS